MVVVLLYCMHIMHNIITITTCQWQYLITLQYYYQAIPWKQGAQSLEAINQAPVVE